MTAGPGYTRVTRSEPCPICGRTRWCSVRADREYTHCRYLADGATWVKTDKDGLEYYVHRKGGDRPPTPIPVPRAAPAVERADPDTLSQVYQALLGALVLSPAHREKLQARGLKDEQINRAGYRSMPGKGRARIVKDLHQRFGDVVLRVPGIYRKESEGGEPYLSLAGPEGTLIPIRDTAGRVLALKIRRDAVPEGGQRYLCLSSAGRGGAGPGSPVHVPVDVRGPAEVVRVTEGELKADVIFALDGLPTIGLAGLGWASAVEPLQALGARTVRLAFDADVATNPNVARALKAAVAGYREAGLAVELDVWDLEDGKGLDDVLARGLAPLVKTGAEVDELVKGWVGEPEKGQADQPAPSEPQPAAPEQTPVNSSRQGYLWEVISSAELMRGDWRPEWLVKRLLVKGQPAVIGGPQKSLKTSIGIDLAVSLASGTPFLGCDRFPVPHARKVAVLSGESGQHAIRSTALRVCEARGLDLAALPILWGFSLPQLANLADLDELARGIKDAAVEAAMIDPLYLSLLAGGGKDLSASNLYDIGPLLLAVSRTILQAGATPTLMHHSVKASGRTREPLDLADLAFSGVAEFARQWLLINRREPFNPDSGTSKLWLGTGGSCGQGGLYALDIEEGVLDEDFGGRCWEVTVKTGTEERGEQTEARQQQRLEKQRADEEADERKFLATLDRIDRKCSGVTLNRLVEESGKMDPGQKLSRFRADKALVRLLEQGVLKRVKVTVGIGNNGQRLGEGFRRNEG